MAKDRITKQDRARAFLEDIAIRTRLREGAEGVARIITAVASEPGQPLIQIARKSRLPLPVAAAIRRELEKENVLVRSGGLNLAEKGLELFKALGIGFSLNAVCDTCDGKKYLIPERLGPLLDLLKTIHERMPPVDVTLDQAFGTPETSMRRAVYMYENGDLAGKKLLCLGDDDLVSISAALLIKEIDALDATITVVDADSRIIQHIANAAADFGLCINVREHDLREPLPADLIGAFDTVETDPPFTVEGIRLFAARGISALRNFCGTIYLSFPHKDPNEMLEIERELIGLGLAIQELIPDFNEYAGASILGNISQIARLVSTGSVPKEIKPENIYTADKRNKKSVYICLECKAEIILGENEAPKTIETLKVEGCRFCGNKIFRRGRPK